MDSSGSLCAVGDDVGTGHLVVVGLGMAAVDAEEVEMPMGEVAEDDSTVDHGSLDVMGVSRAVVEALDVGTGRGLFVDRT